MNLGMGPERRTWGAELSGLKRSSGTTELHQDFEQLKRNMKRNKDSFFQYTRVSTTKTSGGVYRTNVL